MLRHIASASMSIEHVGYSKGLKLPFYCWFSIIHVGHPSKSSILMGLSIANHPFWGTPVYGKPQVFPKGPEDVKVFPSIQALSHQYRLGESSPIMLFPYQQMPWLCSMPHPNHLIAIKSQWNPMKSIDHHYMKGSWNGGTSYWDPPGPWKHPLLSTSGAEIPEKNHITCRSSQAGTQWSLCRGSEVDGISTCVCAGRPSWAVVGSRPRRFFFRFVKIEQSRSNIHGRIYSCSSRSKPDIEYTHFPNHLVGGLEHFLFSHILGIIIPID